MLDFCCGSRITSDNNTWNFWESYFESKKWLSFFAASPTLFLENPCKMLMKMMVFELVGVGIKGFGQGEFCEHFFFQVHFQHRYHWDFLSPKSKTYVASEGRYPIDSQMATLDKAWIKRSSNMLQGLQHIGHPESLSYFALVSYNDEPYICTFKGILQIKLLHRA